MYIYFFSFLGAWKISVASEAKEHSLAKVLVGPNLDAETEIFTVLNCGSGKQFRNASMAYASDLVTNITQLLDLNDQ